MSDGTGQGTTGVGYSALAYSVVGPSHARVGTPNQDAQGVGGGGDGARGPLVLGVSDGHGSARCFRSDRGSRAAIDVGIAALVEHAARLNGPADVCEKMLREVVVPEIVSAWRERVKMDLLREAVTTAELEKLEAAAGKRARATAESAAVNYVAYGATLLIVAMAPSGMAALQIGDGDMLMVDVDEKVSEVLPDDPTLMADETTSLCQMDCEKKFRVRFVPRSVVEPLLVQLSTDGYGNSFSTRAGFERTPLDYLGLLRESGRGVLDEHMAQWLSETTGGGSGDDCTVGLMWRGVLPAAVVKSADVQSPALAEPRTTLPLGAEGLENCTLIRPAQSSGAPSPAEPGEGGN